MNQVTKPKKLIIKVSYLVYDLKEGACNTYHVIA